METFKLTYPGGDWNEDFCYIDNNIGFVLDGTTGLYNQKITNLSSDAMWYSHTMGEYLITALNNTQKSIFDILKTGVKLITKKYKQLAKSNKILAFPSSTASIARIINDKIEFYTLADSIILIQDKFNHVFEIYDTRNYVNNEINRINMQNKAIEKGCSFNDVFKHHKDVIRESRTEFNTIGHTYVLSNNIKAVDMGLCFKMNIKDISKVIIMSDGFSQCFDTFNFITKEQFIKQINNIEDAKALYEKLHKMQQEDISCNKYLRAKVTDDASMVYFNFE